NCFGCCAHRKCCLAPRLGGTAGTSSMNGDIVATDLKTFGQSESRPTLLGGEIDIKNVATFVAMKVAMLAHIGAIPHRRAIQIHFVDKVAFDEKVQAVINGGH